MPKIEETVRKVINKTAELYDLGTAEVSVTLTNNTHIQQINREYRNKDAATDVISFALNEGEEPQIIDGPEINMLGDILISIERAVEQAEAYGHSVEREVAFLTVHGMMHLLGYDHIDEEDRKEMRKEEEYVLQHLGISRE
uniref:rRNA maturation RNase YbeY n=1 Tax=Massilibacillus massiliensis TaxID=1806837 RepID=UPI001F2649B0|nr:rRNA maturation RNase YbeY [Massilibacillus massiliensis]